MNNNKEYIEINKDTFPTPFSKRLNGYMQGWDDCLSSVMQHKTADVELVRHGKWIEHHGQSYLVLPMKYDKDGEPILQPYISYECSICGRRESVKEPYCHCGAKMDEGK